MNTPDQPPSRVDDSELTDEDLAEQFRPSPIVIQRKAFFIWLAAAAGAASLLTVTAIIAMGRFHGQEEISRLEKAVATLTGEKQVALKQLDELRNSHYAQVIAERRCEVIDGLEDCLKAGLKRPERFAEIDRQFLEAKRAPAAKPAEQGTATTARTAARTARTESVARQPAAAPPAPPGTTGTTGKMSMDEFARELSNIPGVAVEGQTVEQPARAADDKKGRTHTGKAGP